MLGSPTTTIEYRKVVSPRKKQRKGRWASSCGKKKKTTLTGLVVLGLRAAAERERDERKVLVNGCWSEEGRSFPTSRTYYYYYIPGCVVML